MPLNYFIPVFGIVLLLTFISCEHVSEYFPEGNITEPAGSKDNRIEKAAGATIHQQSNLYSFTSGMPVEGASSTLLRTNSNLRITIHTTDLPPGDTFTIWWVVFNFPENCEHPVESLMACSEEDLFNESVGATVLYAAGNIAGGKGKSNFASSLRSFDLKDCQPPFDDFGLCRDGLANPFGAEIHLVVRSHGQKIPGMVSDQINTFTGGCTPETSFGAGTGPNECLDFQFAIFVP